MTDPRRWSEETEADDATREFLLAGQTRRMPESERRAVWAGIALSLPAAPPLLEAGLPAPAAGASALSAYLTKGLLFLATLGGLGIAAVKLWPGAEPVLTPPATVQAAAPLAPTAAEPIPLGVESAVPTPEAATATLEPPSSAKARVVPESQLREESLAVLAARAALRSGKAAQSLALLEQARAKFPRGALGQEREALTIEALARSGQAAAARRRAEAFLRAHPKSPYVADVRRIAQR